jgi:hypothetical protein
MEEVPYWGHKHLAPQRNIQSPGRPGDWDFCFPDYVVNQIKPDEVDRVCRTQGWRIHDFFFGKPEENYCLLDRRVYGRIILNWIIKKRDSKFWTGMG